MQVRDPEVRLGSPALHGIAEDALDGRADRQRAPGRGVGLPDDARQPADKAREPLLRARRRRLRPRPRPLGLAVQPGVLQRERGLVSERLEQPRFLLVEAPPRAVLDDEGADRAALDEQRCGELRLEARLLELRAQLGRERDTRVGQDVRRCHGPPLADGEPDGADPGGEHRAVDGEGPGISRDGHGRPGAGVRRDPDQRRGVSLEQPEHAVGDALRDDFGVERLRDEPPDLGQALRRAAAVLAALVDAGVAERDRGLVGEPRQDGLIPIRERPRRAVVDVEQALDPAVDRDRNDQGGPDAVGLDEREVVLAEAGIAGVVLRPEGAAAPQHQAAEALARLDRHAGERVGEPGRVAHERHLAVRLPERNHREVRAAELSRALGDGRQHRREVERGVDRPREVGDDLGLAPPPLGVLEQPRVLQGERRLVGEAREDRELVGREHASRDVGQREPCPSSAPSCRSQAGTTSP